MLLNPDFFSSGCGRRHCCLVRKFLFCRLEVGTAVQSPNMSPLHVEEGTAVWSQILFSADLKEGTAVQSPNFFFSGSEEGVAVQS